MYTLVIYDLAGTVVEDLGKMTLAEIKEYAKANYVGAGKLFPNVTALNHTLEALEEMGGDSWLIGGGHELRITRVEEPEVEVIE